MSNLKEQILSLDSYGSNRVPEKMREEELKKFRELEPIKAEISNFCEIGKQGTKVDALGRKINEKGKVLDKKGNEIEPQKEVELDFEKIKERQLELYLDSGYSEALGLTKEEFEQEFEKMIKEAFKKISEKQDLIKESIEKEGFNDILILINEIKGKEISRFLHFKLLIEQAKNKKEENLFSSQSIDSDFDGDTYEEKINNIQIPDLDRLDKKLIEALNKEGKLKDLLKEQGKTLADITKPRPKIQVCLIKNYQEVEKKTLSKSAADLWEELKEKNQTHLLPEAYMFLQREWIKKNNLEDLKIEIRQAFYLGLDIGYTSWLAGVSSYGVSQAYLIPNKLGFWIDVYESNYRSKIRGGRPVVVLFEK